jgi:hypothetical protein
MIAYEAEVNGRLRDASPDAIAEELEFYLTLGEAVEGSPYGFFSLEDQFYYLYWSLRRAMRVRVDVGLRPWAGIDPRTSRVVSRRSPCRHAA